MPGWFGAADSFVFPSISEGWGLVVLEALAAGLPVVASDIEVFREFLTHDVDAVLTGAADPASLAAGMARVRDDRELVRRLRSAGAVTADRYSWTSTARRHIEIYAEA
ncbi:MAG: glycosyltransferase [Acidimicrobiaceae bacterium]|nr:glycosyltransferase [Acidimicrobiaceae bacterium]